MRIALVITALGAGGAERVLITLANSWAARGWQVRLVTFEPPGTTPYYPVDPRVELSQLGIESVGRPLWRAVLRGIKRVRSLRATLRAHDPDVVISFLAKINVLTMLATRGLGVPVVVSERNNPDRQQFRPLWRSLRERLYGVAQAVVTPSRGVLEALPRTIRERGCVIPNPVDLAGPVRRGGDTRQLVAVGRLVEQKGFDLLLEAFAGVAPDLPEWTLVIWGEGELRSALERQRDRLGLTDRVRLPGLTERPGQWVENAEAFVLSSRFESFGNVITEAMVAGLPIVSFNCPFGPGDILRDEVDGLLVAPEDARALAGAMRRLLGDPELRCRLGAAAQENVRRFSPEAFVARWDAVVATAAAGAIEDTTAPLEVGHAADRSRVHAHDV